MSRVFPPRAVLATDRSTSAMYGRLIAPRTSRLAVRSVVRSILQSIALGLVVVALVPRTSGAQTTGSATHSTRHTVSALVGAVTQAAILSHQRLTAEQARLLSPHGDVVQPDRAWISTVDVRGNVSGVLQLEPHIAATGNASWRVMNADGQLVPWTSQLISISPSLSAGRHTVSLIWLAPDGVSAPPEALLRVQPSP